MTESKTVLIVEDDSAIRGDLEALLELEGYLVVVAPHGKAALEVLAELERPPAVVLLDIMMPVMDGWEFRAAQILDPRFALIPVVVMTADGHAPQKAAKMQAAGYIQKPIDIDRLLETLNRCAA